MLKQDKRMALIEKALINSGAINAEDMPEEGEEDPKPLEYGRLFHKNSETKDIVCRHSERYIRRVAKN